MNPEISRKKRMHYVLSTSGWQGDRWSLDSIHDTRAEAESRAAEIYNPDAKSDGHLTAVVSTSVATSGEDENTIILDTSRLRFREPHLTCKRCRVFVGNDHDGM